MKNNYKEKTEEYKIQKSELNKIRREQMKQYILNNKDEIIKKYPTKICSKCKQELDRSMFYDDYTSLDGLSYWCKFCQHDYDLSRREAKRQSGREKYNSEKAMKYYYDNKNDIMQKTKEKQKQRRQIDQKFVIDHTMQNLLNSIVKAKRQNSPSLVERCGYTAQQLLEHLESQFTSDMSWDNYGEYWEIDHIKPKYSFNYTSYNDTQFKECWSLFNLRPLSIKENQSRNKIDY